MLLGEARQKAEMSQADLAEQLGRPQSFVSKYERGERRLDIVEYIHVARRLGADPVSFAALIVKGVAS